MLRCGQYREVRLQIVKERGQMVDVNNMISTFKDVIPRLEMSTANDVMAYF